MLENEEEDFYKKRSARLKERILRRIEKRPDDIIGTGRWEYYLWQTWCVRAKKWLCFLVDKRCDLQSDHYVQMTQLLTAAHEQWWIHPLFHPVPVRDAPQRPYLVREQIFGRTLDSTNTSDIAFTYILGKVLSQQLLQLNILPCSTSQTTDKETLFDLRCENFIVQNIDTDILFPTILNLEGSTDETSIEFLETLHQAGGKVWIFDYGSWLRPDGKKKNQ